MEENIILEVAEVSKSFGGVKALINVKLSVYEGEVHAVVGENGAGKSTLMKIIGGIVKRDSGKILFYGKEIEFHNPIEAINAGIAIIHQELPLLPALNVMENIYMGRMPSRCGFVDWKKAELKTIELFERLDVKVDPHGVVGQLSVSRRQIVEIAKAISINASVIIMDEPNSSLDLKETEKLFNIIQKLKQERIAIIYVSHKIEEVLRISDRITVLKDGYYINTIDKKDTTLEKVINMMVGRELSRDRVRRKVDKDIILKVDNLSSNKFKNVSFCLYRKEILGFSGLIGSGRSEVARAIFGADSFSKGEIFFEEKRLKIRSPQQGIKLGIAMLPEDRKELSLFLKLPILLNICIAILPKVRKGLSLNYNKMREIGKSYKEALNIKLGNLEDPIASLSGGNAQKTIIARWLAIEPKILILDEPTHGVDIGAKAEIYNIIHDLTNQGVSIILISSELPEIIAISDRVVVMHEGHVTGILEGDDINEDKIMSCASGVNTLKKEVQNVESL